jgi:hypothetical protein
MRSAINDDLSPLDATRDVAYIKTGSFGFHAWDISDVRQFEETHPIGTKARLALAVLLFPRRVPVRRGALATGPRSGG